ncbi:hypothetical protein [Methylocystis heyeri]|uniref:Uncharacterized protein n=1 Tax=Methylocystis heyeri TaxID=391905 RepID=A0A6B8K8P1_9HYPH|nr:hypothetical protein [Methylocystis heyeri]QGM44279.1 hypothetical protein H2LOC_000380 [Methylocystis heyeri]
MAELTENQKFNLLLADIAMAAAISTVGSSFDTPDAYVPGVIRDKWLAEARDEVLKRRVLSLANAGVASLQGVDAEQLLRAAQRYSVPVDEALAARMVEFFADKREALLRYRR